MDLMQHKVLVISIVKMTKNCLNCSMEGNTTRKGKLDKPGLMEKEECKRYAYVTSFNVILASS